MLTLLEMSMEAEGLGTLGLPTEVFNPALLKALPDQKDDVVALPAPSLVGSMSPPLNLSSFGLDTKLLSLPPSYFTLQPLVNPTPEVKAPSPEGVPPHQCNCPHCVYGVVPVPRRTRQFSRGVDDDEDPTFSLEEDEFSDSDEDPEELDIDHVPEDDEEGILIEERRSLYVYGSVRSPTPEVVVETPKTANRNRRRQSADVVCAPGQIQCCIIGCENPVKNRLRFSLRGYTVDQFKPDFINCGWHRVCHKHYFADLYQWKKKQGLLKKKPRLEM